MKNLKFLLTIGLLWKMLIQPLMAVDNADNNSDNADNVPTFSAPTNNPIYVNGYSAGLSAGMNQCRQFPAACGIGKNSTFSGQIEATPEGYIINVIDGMTQCQQDPASCQIVVNQNTDGSTQAGITQCTQDPKSCGIDLKGTKEEGIAQCRRNPQSCGIIVDTEALIQQGMTICQADPQTCGITLNESAPLPHATFSLPAGEFSVPAVDVLNLLDDTMMTYQVQLKLIPGREPLSFSLVEAIPLPK